jgi:hypothetical protein
MRAASFSAPLTDADVGDLTAEVEVEQLKTILHAARLERLERAQDFSDGEAELRPVAA